VLPIGKLPADLLAQILEKTPVNDPRVLLGPGVGLDCAVIETGESLLVLKSDPITFATDAIGWYAVQVAVNDIATTGAIPRWLLVTSLLPEKKTTPGLVETVQDQLHTACQEIGVSIVGGHTEITYGLDRPILVVTLIGEVNRDQLITPRGAKAGDRLLLTKGVPIEATAILAREFGDQLIANEFREEFPIKPNLQNRNQTGMDSVPLSHLNETELEQARNYLYQPGISVLSEARLAIQAGRVHAMHDPTEGGIYTALWELAQASGLSIQVDLSSIPVSELSARVCKILGIDPLSAIASGALLLAVPEGEASVIRKSIQEAGILCTDIGEVVSEPGPPHVWSWTRERSLHPIPRPERDGIARLFE